MSSWAQREGLKLRNAGQDLPWSHQLKWTWTLQLICKVLTSILCLLPWLLLGCYSSVLFSNWHNPAYKQQLIQMVMAVWSTIYQLTAAAEVLNNN